MILYPKADGSTFDMEYYTSTHLPMVAKAFGDGCVSWGAATVTSGNHTAMGWLIIKDMDVFTAVTTEHGATFEADVANYTDLQPEVVLGQVTGGS
ncbi:MAG: EthD family reductase [Ilumatobacteraceae bacterium]